MRGIIFPLVVICIFGFIIIKGNIDNKINAEKNKRKFIDNYGKSNTRKWKNGELERISIYAKYRESEQTIDELTWNDLDMNLIYQQMVYTESSLGDDYLYYLLEKEETKDLAKLMESYMDKYCTL